MKSYLVKGYIDVRIHVEVTIDAEDEEDAVAQAEERFGTRDDITECFENEDVVESQVEETTELP